MSTSSSSSSPTEPTVSQKDQWAVETDVFQIYNHFFSSSRHDQTLLLDVQRDKHIEYLTRGLKQLGPSFSVLDANRPWLCYWIIHSLALLGEYIDKEQEENAVDFLNRCQDPDGGYGGGPGQLPHLATTYAAVNALITLGGDGALLSINRNNMRKFLLRMKDASGGFRMHDGGEIDVRACYTAVSVASVLNILDHDLIHNLRNYILSCQTYEGGIGGEPGSEAHGGYTFCGLAAMILIDEVQRLDLPRLIDWLAFRQGVECGFQGRTNKLVDGCYSFWQGGAFALVQRLGSVVNEQLGQDASDHATESTDSAETSESSEEQDDNDKDGSSSHYVHSLGQEGTKDARMLYDSNIGFSFLERHALSGPIFHSIGLQQYILLCSQVQDGGFKDKPGKYRDYYHTCYCLSGLSVSQYSWSRNADSPPLPRSVVGSYSNRLEPVHPLYNIVLDKYNEAHEFYCRC